MASAAPALDLSTAPAEDPPKFSSNNSDDPNSPAIESLSDHPIAPDQFDPKWETDKIEVWSYYTYYIGNNGLTLFNFAPTAFQNLLSQAVTDGNGTTLKFAGSERNVNSIVLLSNGISFAIQIFVFLLLGSFAGMSLLPLIGVRESRRG